VSESRSSGPRARDNAKEDSVRPAGEQLFDDDARALAAEHARDSHYRWLTLSDDGEAVALRRVLNASWRASGRSQLSLRKGLEHERWGQHIGAMAQLLTLGFLSKLGLSVESEPRLSERTPDLYLSKGPHGALVEVRSMAGCGAEPWAAEASAPQDGRDHVRPGQRVSEKLKRQRARRQAQARSEAQAALDKSLADSVAQALRHKADRYRELALSHGLPLVICLYQDTDTQIAQRVIDWGFGAASKGRPASEGAFAQQSEQLSHLSAVLVLGRCPLDPTTQDPATWAQTALELTARRPTDVARPPAGAAEHTLALRGELILNPETTLPLPAALRPRELAVFAREDGADAPRWSHGDPPLVEL